MSGSRSARRARARCDAGPPACWGGRALRFELRGLTSAELRADFDIHRIVNCGFLPRPYQDPEPRRTARVLHCRLPQGRDRGGGTRAQPPHLRGFPGGRRARGHRDGPLLERGAGLRGQQPDRTGLLRDSGGHPARPLASRLAEAAEAPGSPNAQVLLLRCGRGEPALAPARRTLRGLRTLREGPSKAGSSTRSARTSPTRGRRSVFPTGASPGAPKWTSSSATCGSPSRPRGRHASGRGT